MQLPYRSIAHVAAFPVLDTAATASRNAVQLPVETPAVQILKLTAGRVGWFSKITLGLVVTGAGSG